MKRALSESAIDRIIADLKRQEENRIAREAHAAWRESTENDLAAYEERNREILHPDEMPLMPQVVESLQPGKPEDLKLEEVMQFLAAIDETHGEEERDRIVQCMRQIYSLAGFAKAAAQ